ncbi:hypothetical protein ACJX0J_032053, partial [Zea mays]
MRYIISGEIFVVPEILDTLEFTVEDFNLSGSMQASSSMEKYLKHQSGIASLPLVHAVADAAQWAIAVAKDMASKLTLQGLKLQGNAFRGFRPGRVFVFKRVVTYDYLKAIKFPLSKKIKRTCRGEYELYKVMQGMITERYNIYDRQYICIVHGMYNRKVSKITRGDVCIIIVIRYFVHDDGVIRYLLYIDIAGYSNE